MKPLITYALFAYNQERYIKDALASAFGQTYSPLEIILSDDCSSDKTFDLMKVFADSYKGPHSILLNRNDHNLGIGAHINRVMELATGDLVVVAAGDDISLPHRVMRTYHIYENTKAKSIFSNCLTIDENGTPSSRLYEEPLKEELFSARLYVEKELHVAGCSLAWTRDVFEIFGPLITPLTVEDWVIPLRSALLGSIRYIDEILVLHRVHGNNAWNYRITNDADKDINFEKFWLFEKKVIYQNWIKDLEIMKQIDVLRTDELIYLQNIIRHRLQFNNDKLLMLSANTLDIITTLSKNILRTNYSLNSIRHDIGYFLVPTLYRKYLQVKYL